MGKAKPRDECYTFGEFDDALEQGGAEYIRCSGSHVMRRKTFLGRVFTFCLPNHGRNKRLSPGVRHQIIKLMAMAGIPVLILAIWMLAPHLV